MLFEAIHEVLESVVVTAKLHNLYLTLGGVELHLPPLAQFTTCWRSCCKMSLSLQELIVPRIFVLSANLNTELVRPLWR